MMIDYGKTENFRVKINASIGKNRFIDTDWLVSVDSLISTYVYLDDITCLTKIGNTEGPG